MAKHRTTQQLLKEAENRASALRDRAQKEDTRRRILIGSVLLGRAAADDATMERLLRDLDGWLSSGHRDRRLFQSYGLGPIRELCGATLFPVPTKRNKSGKKQRQPFGWAFGRALPSAVQRDRYGNLISG